MCLNCGAPYVVRDLKTGEVLATNMTIIDKPDGTNPNEGRN